MYFLIGVRRPPEGETESQARESGESQEKNHQTAKNKETKKETNKPRQLPKQNVAFVWKGEILQMSIEVEYDSNVECLWDECVRLVHWAGPASE